MYDQLFFWIALNMQNLTNANVVVSKKICAFSTKGRVP